MSEYKQPYFPKAYPDSTFLPNFKPELITSIERLQEVIELNKDKKFVAFDTETTGLTFFKDKIVGFSFSFNNISGYYVPLRHKNGVNLPIEALHIFYETCLKTKNVLFFNAIFDCFMLIGEGLNTFILKKFDVMVLVYNADADSTEKNLKFASEHYLGRKPPTFEDTLMQKNIREAVTLENTTLLKLNKELNTLINEHLIVITESQNIPENKYSNEKELKVLIKDYKKQIKNKEAEIKAKKKEITSLMKIINNLKTKKPKYVVFDELLPEEAYFYAVCDTANTFGLFSYLLPLLHKEFQTTILLESGEKLNILELDNKLINAMIYYQQCPVYIDTERMRKLCIELETKLIELDQEIFEFFGYPFNLNSNDELTKALMSKGLHTGVYTDGGKSGIRKMAVNKEALANLNHPIKDKIFKRSSTSTQLNNYAVKFTEKNQGYISYNPVSASTGRILSGNTGGKNEYFLNLNFQNLTKPKTTNYRAFHKSHPFYNHELLKDIPDILDYKFLEVKKDEYVKKIDKETGEVVYEKDDLGNFIIDKDGNKVPKMVVGPLFINNIEIEDSMYIVDGPKQELNIRAAVTRPDDNWLFVSIDYSSEELAVAGILSGEPNYLKPYRNEEDIHRQVALSMWGEENYGPDKRKYAKKLNFSMIYGGSIYSLVHDQGFDPSVAEDVFARFWKGLNILKIYQSKLVRETKYNTNNPDRKGTCYTYFGRPRRFPGILKERENYKEYKQAERAVFNHPVQGTSGDIIRIDLVNLYQEVFAKIPNVTNEIKFVGTVHDEIDLLLHKDTFYKWIPKLKEMLQIKFPERDITLRVEFEVGTNFGYTFVFALDKNGVFHPQRN